ncbi:type IV pilus modification PilV family protein [Paenisporosarcina sp. NPDC076898]|uniref:type IV pilus modification PilV family protein n=1 Tax=unclassified Paenisporosarcina TaxID=2642018 RepID=UPI003D07C7AE
MTSNGDKKHRLLNENGLTLVEILAAILILSLVLLSFMAMFTQSAKYTAHNRETLSSVEIAEDVIGKIRMTNDFTELGNLKKITVTNGVTNRVDVSATDAFKGLDPIEVINSGNSNYKVFLTMKAAPTNINTLKRVEIEVKPINATIKDSKPFKTEIFIEVSGL